MKTPILPCPPRPLINIDWIDIIIALAFGLLTNVMSEKLESSIPNVNNRLLFSTVSTVLVVGIILLVAAYENSK